MPIHITGKGVSMPQIRCFLLLLTVSFFTQAQKTLVYSDHQPLEGMRTTFLKDILFPAIEKESNGQLKIEAHWNGELAIAYEGLNAVKEGKVDIATVVPEYTAKELPIHQLFKSFAVGPSDKKQISFFKEVYQDIPELREELADNNIYDIFYGTGYSVGFFSREPIPNLLDLDQEKWRSASFLHLDFLKNLGAAPVRMHWGPEIYEALKEQTLDGIMVNIDSGYNLKVHEHAPYVLASKDLWLGHLYLVAMNMDTWKNLTPNEREAIKRATISSYKKLDNTMKKSFKEQLKTLQEEGAKVRVLSKKEIEDLAKRTKYKDVQDKWVNEQEENGVQHLKEVLTQLRTIHTKL